MHIFDSIKDVYGHSLLRKSYIPCRQGAMKETKLIPKRPYKYKLVANPNFKLPGLNLPRRKWSKLNRFRCGQGRSNYLILPGETWQNQE